MPIALRQLGFGTVLLICAFFVATAGWAVEPESPPGRRSKFAVPETNRLQAKRFHLELQIANGHIGSVFIGCQKGATDAYDNGLDDMAPPPGIGGAGYTFLISPDRKHNLYKDIRAYADTIQWLFYAKPGHKPVDVSWDGTQIPDGWKLYCARWDGRSETVTDTVNCRETQKVTAESTTFFRFWMVRDKVAPQE